MQSSICLLRRETGNLFISPSDGLNKGLGPPLPGVRMFNIAPEPAVQVCEILDDNSLRSIVRMLEIYQPGQQPDTTKRQSRNRPS